MDDRDSTGNAGLTPRPERAPKMVGMIFIETVNVPPEIAGTESCPLEAGAYLAGSKISATPSLALWLEVCKYAVRG